MAPLKALKDIPTIAYLYRTKVIKPSSKDISPANQEYNDKICTIKYDLTALQVDAIVNAANRSLLGGGGVDGAIHNAAGPELLKECRKLGGCATGSAKITDAYDLPCKKVIHAVGPVFKNDDDSQPLLRGCYRTALQLAVENNCKSIAFAAISTGIYGYPSEAAAKAALREVMSFLKRPEGQKLDKIIFCTFLDKDVRAYNMEIPEVFAPTQEDLTEAAPKIHTTKPEMAKMAARYKKVDSSGVPKQRFFWKEFDAKRDDEDGEESKVESSASDAPGRSSTEIPQAGNLHKPKILELNISKITTALKPFIEKYNCRGNRHRGDDSTSFVSPEFVSPISAGSDNTTGRATSTGSTIVSGECSPRRPVKFMDVNTPEQIATPRQASSFEHEPMRRATSENPATPYQGTTLDRAITPEQETTPQQITTPGQGVTPKQTTSPNRAAALERNITPEWKATSDPPAISNRASTFDGVTVPERANTPERTAIPKKDKTLEQITALERERTLRRKVAVDSHKLNDQEKIKESIVFINSETHDRHAEIEDEICRTEGELENRISSKSGSGSDDEEWETFGVRSRSCSEVGVSNDNFEISELRTGADKKRLEINVCRHNWASETCVSLWPAGRSRCDRCGVFMKSTTWT